MSNLRNSLLPMLGVIRGIPVTLGLRLYNVTVRTRAWSGPRVGVGNKTDVDKPLNEFDGQPPPVRQVTGKEVIASGGLYKAQDLKVGPLTAVIDDTTLAYLDPQPSGGAIEVFYHVTGPSLGADGAWYSKVADDLTNPLSYYVYLRKLAVKI